MESLLERCSLVCRDRELTGRSPCKLATLIGIGLRRRSGRSRCDCRGDGSLYLVDGLGAEVGWSGYEFMEEWRGAGASTSSLLYE